MLSGLFSSVENSFVCRNSILALPSLAPVAQAQRVCANPMPHEDKGCIRAFMLLAAQVFLLFPLMEGEVGRGSLIATLHRDKHSNLRLKANMFALYRWRRVQQN